MIESSLAVCPFCEELVGAEAVQYGSERLHPACYENLGREIEPFTHSEALALMNLKSEPVRDLLDCHAAKDRF